MASNFVQSELVFALYLVFVLLDVPQSDLEVPYVDHICYYTGRCASIGRFIANVCRICW